MNDEQLLRYSRHILLPEIDVDGQEKLLAARVLVIGLGGLGSPVVLYLAASGVGQLILADGDTVELSNLQRQVLHNMQSIGKSKVASAIEAVSLINPDVMVSGLEVTLDQYNLADAVARADIVVDCSDNFATRYQVNRACINAGKPLVSAAAIRWEGQVALFDPARGGPCYQCLYPESEDQQAERCSESGVLSPLLGVVGSLQAAEVIKYLLGKGQSLSSGLLVVDLLNLDIRRLLLKADPECPACSRDGLQQGGSHDK